MNGDQVSQNLTIESIPVRGNHVAIPFKYNITVLAVISGHFKMYVALSPNYGLCKSAQKNNINNLVQIAHSDCLITTIILQISYQP